MPDELELARARARAREREAASTAPPARSSVLRDLLTLDKNTAESAMDMMTAGVSGFVGDLAASALPNQPSFRELRDARQARRNALPIWASLAAAVPAMATPMSSVLGPAKVGASAIRAAGKGAVEGMIQGGAASLGENVGTSSGAVVPTLMGVAGGGVFGGAAGGIASRIANRGMARSSQNAARMLANAAEIDGSRSVPVGPNMPMPMAADALGETGQGIVRAAGRIPEARAELRPALEGRTKEMFPSLLRSLDETTGTTTDEAVRLSQEIRAAEQARDAANGAQKQKYAEQVRQLKEQHRMAVEKARADYKAAKPSPRTPTDAVNALNAEGAVPDVDATLREMQKARGKVGEGYKAVWENTRGQEVPETDASRAFLNTAIGKKVWAKVQQERADLTQFDEKMALPKRPVRPGSADFEPVPDAEAWHRMKQYVNDAAKVGAGQGPIEGVTAADAIFAREKMLPALKEQSKAAAGVDLQYADMSDEMRAFAAGANKGRWSKSFDEMKPAEQEAYRAGRRAYLGNIVRSGRSRDALAKQLADPNNKLAQDVELAFGNGASKRIADQIATPQQAPFAPPARPVVPPEPAPIPPSPEAAGFLAGESIFDAPVIGSGSRPSVSEVRKSLLDLPEAGQKAGQKGLAGRYRNTLLEGRQLDLTNPASRERFAMAATSPDAARQMVDTEGAWNAATKMQDKVLSGDVVVPSEKVPDVFGDIAGGVSMNPGWWFTLSARRRAAEMLSARNAEEQAKTAKEITRLAKSKLGAGPDAVSRAIDALKKLDAKKAKWSTSAATRAGRVGGLLTSF